MGYEYLQVQSKSVDSAPEVSIDSRIHNIRSKRLVEGSTQDIRLTNSNQSGDDNMCY